VWVGNSVIVYGKYFYNRTCLTIGYSSVDKTEPGRILIVDDEILNIEIIHETLVDYGFYLMTAQNGVDALIIAREGQPDLILLDIMMPGMDGFAVCAQLKSEPATRNIPIIFLSALIETEQKLRAFKLGGVDYITKPFEPREVMARVMLHLDQHRLCQCLQQRLEAYGPAGPAIPNTTPPAATELSRSVITVSDYLLENLACNPSLDELARIAATNRSSLNHEFQKFYCMSVFDWLREQRLLRATLLLRTTQLPILSIANRVGYISHAGFTTAFHRRFGISPRECRSSAMLLNEKSI